MQFKVAAFKYIPHWKNGNPLIKVLSPGQEGVIDDRDGGRHRSKVWPPSIGTTMYD